MTPAFHSEAVAARFHAYPPQAEKKLLALRQLIFATARTLPQVQGLEETLKWGEPAYLTTNRAGTTIRIDWKAKAPGRYAMYFHCQTDLVDTFRTLFPDDFEFDGNRALHMSLEDDMPEDALRVCIEAALTYHVARRVRA